MPHTLKIGSVVKFYDAECRPDPKLKRQVIVGISSDGTDIATLYINTGDSSDFNNTPEFANLQHEIKRGNNQKCLSHDSYVDCSDLKYKLRSEIESALARPNGEYLGELSTIDLNKVLSMLHSADSVKPYYLSLCCVPTQYP